MAVSKLWIQRVVANKLLLDHSNPARQSQERQGGMLRSINDASIRPYQRITGIEDAIHSNQYVYQPLAPSGGVHFTSGANVLYRAPAVPARMAMEEMAGNEGSSRRHSYSSDQAAGALPPSGGFVQLGRPLEISTDTDRTAYSSWSYDLCPLSNAWAPSFDIPASKPAAQAVVPRMNIGAPYTGYCHDEGGTSVGAAVCVAASSAPGPTRNIIGACGTARSRSDAAVFHRSPRRAVGYVGYNQTHLKVPTRRATRPSRSRATRGPFVQFEADKDALATRLLNEGADSTAVELLLTHVFNDEVSARALTVNSMCREQPTGASSTRSNYRLLLADVERKDGSKGYCCLLCPQGHRKEYKNPQDSIRHLRKAHFGFAASCTGGWYVSISRVNHS